jgi:antitoxin HicB
MARDAELTRLGFVNKILRPGIKGMIVSYLVELTPDDNGTLLVTCPVLPEVTTFGENEDEAIAHAREAIEEALAARIADGRDLPMPKIRGRHCTAIPLLAQIKIQL